MGLPRLPGSRSERVRPVSGQAARPSRAPDNFFHSCGNPWEIDAIYVVGGGDGVVARASGDGTTPSGSGDAQVAVFWGTFDVRLRT
jgi:hypothetical protein